MGRRFHPANANSPREGAVHPASRLTAARFLAIGSALLLLPAIAGCGKALFFMNADKMKPVAAECNKLAGHKVAVVVWTDQSTLDMDPFAESRTAQQVVYFLQLNRSKDELKGTTLIDPSRVTRLQEQLGVAGSAAPNNEVGEKLGADFVLRVDLFEYTTRAPEANGLIKGRVGGNVAVQRVGQVEPLYRSEVSTEFPEGSKIGVLDRTDEEVLNETLRTFGERVARKFYNHEVKYE